MNSRNHYELMASYNLWMNKNIYTVCAAISDGKRKKDMGAFFKSIHSTLNHILWGDRIWLARFSKEELTLPMIGEDIYTDFGELSIEREKTDRHIMEWMQNIDQNWLAAPFEFTSISDKKTRRAPAWIFVSHMFNHQTHHRGQVTTLIKQLGHEPCVTDIPWMQDIIEIL